MAYWLFKSEPDVYSIDDLAAEPTGAGRWDGIRNYQARNLLRDQVKSGDNVLFYHSSCKVPGVAGTAKIVSAPYADPAQFDSKSPYFDPKATEENPRWFCVDVSLVEKFPTVIPLDTLKQEPSLVNMILFRQGRLSIQPIAAPEWRRILTMAKRLSSTD